MPTIRYRADTSAPTCGAMVELVEFLTLAKSLNHHYFVDSVAHVRDAA